MLTLCPPVTPFQTERNLHLLEVVLNCICRIISCCSLATPLAAIVWCKCLCRPPTTILSQLPINIISAAGQLVIICPVLLGSHSQTSSDSINDLNNGPVIIDADNFESYSIPQINLVF